jgi:hypothetical protein
LVPRIKNLNIPLLNVYCNTAHLLLQRDPGERVEPRHEQHEIHSDITESEPHDEDAYLDAEDFEEFEGAPPNTDVNLDEMAGNYFARVDEIHQSSVASDDEIIDFDDLSEEEDESDQTPLLEALLCESIQPLFPGSRNSRLQFSVILMSLCTLFSVSHHCLDEILTFLKHDVLPADNNCPKSSYEMKAMLLKLGLSHETIHCCDCGRTLY